jgi:hypothetical protein
MITIKTVTIFIPVTLFIIRQILLLQSSPSESLQTPPKVEFSLLGGYSGEVALFSFRAVAFGAVDGQELKL